ncbi:transglycosylase SLT domain-containing protein [Salipiger abyssi]|uniref:Transglycosylase family protein n=1 Tax=Salipiger abyssi TaxID=1250539 RepID=A0A1P8UWU9_9RHOB|nr:transglycosylase SLT domain-containing protein [Salipiger abyssi]APZ53881.1 transglycosylase family protein [Salipiger abyssi]
MTIPEARWGSSGSRDRWSLTVLSSLRGPAKRLPETVPADITTWCPAYPSATREDREAFWLGLVSALAKHESTYRPTAVGGGGLWYGLLQILPSTARLYGCQARSGAALKDPNLNLSCGLRIMAKTVARDGVVSRNMRGVAADWGPFHSRSKREDMIAWTRAQPYCAGLPRSLKPVARPARWGEPAIMAGLGETRPQLPEMDGVVALSINGTIVRKSSDPVIATSGMTEMQERRRAP